MYIDIHTHLLPGIDDGARTIDETRAMLERYRELGFGTVVASPHIYLEESASTWDAVDPLFTEVFEMGATFGVEVVRGGEVRLTPSVQESSPVFEKLSHGTSRNVLVDFPSGAWPFYAEDALFQLQLLGYTPILAHPERYGWQTNDLDTARGLVKRGVILQVTLGSLVGAFGKSAKNISRQLLEAGLVHVLATDAHGVGSRLDAASEGISWIESNFRFEDVVMLLNQNPTAILSQGEILPVAVKKRSRRRFSFGFSRR